MGSNRIGQLAWATLGFIGLTSIVDVGGIPVVICPQCGRWLNLLIGCVLIAISAAAFITNRRAVAQTGTSPEKEG